MKNTLLTLFLLFSLNIYSQTFDIQYIQYFNNECIKSNIKENRPSLIIIEDDEIIKICYKNTLNLFFIINYWNEEKITWYDLKDNKGNYYEATLTKFKNYYIFSIYNDNIQISYTITKST